MTSLREVNDVVTRIGLPPLDEATREKLVSVESKAHILRAIREAPKNDNAQTFLKKAYARAGLIDPASGDSGQASSATPAPQPLPEPPAGGSAEAGAASARATAPEATPPARPAPAPNEPPKASSTPPTGEAPDRLSYHIYGGKSALCFEADTRRDGTHATVAIDAALAVSERSYDWQNKLRLQVTPSEFYVVAGVMLGILKGCEFGNHGPENNKGFSFVRQDGGKVYARVHAKDETMRAVPIEAPDVVNIASLFIRQMRKNHPWLDAQGVIQLLHRTLAHYEPRLPRG
jgi:hypothetical protein